MFDPISLTALIASLIALGGSAWCVLQSVPATMQRQVDSALATSKAAQITSESACDRVDAIRAGVDTVLDQALDRFDAAEKKRRSAEQSERRQAQRANGTTQPQTRDEWRAQVYGRGGGVGGFGE